MRLFGHIRRRDGGYIGTRMLKMQLLGKRKRRRPKRTFMDVVREGMHGVTEENAENRKRPK